MINHEIEKGFCFILFSSFFIFIISSFNMTENKPLPQMQYVRFGNTGLRVSG